MCFVLFQSFQFSCTWVSVCLPLSSCTERGSMGTRNLFPTGPFLGPETKNETVFWAFGIRANIRILLAGSKKVRIPGSSLAPLFHPVHWFLTHNKSANRHFQNFFLVNAARIVLRCTRRDNNSNNLVKMNETPLIPTRYVLQLVTAT